MAEQFRKTYISVHEFVGSWDKEVYELTNIDYFIYLLINDLAGEMESAYLAKLSDTNFLQLHSEEIGTLAFNIGDGLQQFFEKNCFSECLLNCPTHLKDPVSLLERKERKIILEEPHIPGFQCRSKEQCLHFDVLHYVVIDTLLDFYNFEKELPLTDKDDSILRFAEFVNKIILETIKNLGSKFLHSPKENASGRFDRLLKSSDNDLDEILNFEEEDDEIKEGEEWKLSASGSAETIHKFKEGYLSKSENKDLVFLLDRFSEFLIEFLGLGHVEDLTIEEINEFFSVIAVHELLSANYDAIDAAAQTFKQLIQYLDFNHDMNLESLFKDFLENEFSQIQRTFRIIRDYEQNYPLMEYLISEEANDPNLLDGFFEIISLSGSWAEVEDIHLKTRLKPVDLSHLKMASLHTGDILHMQLIVNGLEFRLVHMEMAYPTGAKKYLF